MIFQIKFKQVRCIKLKKKCIYIISEFKAICHYCQRETKGPQCDYCHKIALLCAVCQIGVRGKHSANGHKIFLTLLLFQINTFVVYHFLIELFLYKLTKFTFHNYVGSCLYINDFYKTKLFTFIQKKKLVT